MKELLSFFIVIVFIFLATGCTLDLTSKEELPLCIQNNKLVLNSSLTEDAINEMIKDTNARCGFAPFVQDYYGTISFIDENGESLKCNLTKSYHLKNDLLKYVGVSSQLVNDEYWTEDRLKTFGQENLACNIVTNSDSSYWEWESKHRFEYLSVFVYNDSTIIFNYRTSVK